VECLGSELAFLCHIEIATYYFYYREKCEKNNAINEKVIEHTQMKGNLKKKKVADKFVQTDKAEDKPKITVTDLTSEGMLS
jgi:hypothetical protein